MQVRRTPGGNIAHVEWRALAPLSIACVVQRWCNWHSADRTRATRACGGGKNAVNQARPPMRLKRRKVCIKVHSFGLSLLLINVGDPHQRCTPCL